MPKTMRLYVVIWVTVVSWWIWDVIAQTPKQTGPLSIKPTARQIELGRKLFFDKRLSQSGTIACASCHDPKRGWGDGLELAVGAGGRKGTRHAPTLVNSAYSPLVFWDGRTVENVTQALLPLANTDEMAEPANRILGVVPQNDQDVVVRLRLIPGYVKLFTDAFPIDPIAGSAITGQTLAVAIAAFETTITSFDAPIDARLKGDKRALSADAEVGYQLFTKSYCTQCHTPPLFTDNLFHNNGVEFATTFSASDRGRAAVVPAALRTAADERAFKTPPLREIKRTAPYGHNGFMADLHRVIRHYSLGGADFAGKRDRNIDRRIVPTGWTPAQQKYVKIFLEEAMSSKNYPHIKEPVLP